ncbi:MAG TPA: hypothetical protein VGG99_16785 [Acetobacteraceae bacterium]|jgi:hypothetical protein
MDLPQHCAAPATNTGGRPWQLEAESGLVRFEVRGLDRDKPLVRRLAERLLHDDPEAQALRSDLANKLGTSVAERGGIYAALRRSPLVGAEFDLTRDVATDRDVSL